MKFEDGCEMYDSWNMLDEKRFWMTKGRKRHLVGVHRLPADLAD